MSRPSLLFWLAERLVGFSDSNSLFPKSSSLPPLRTPLRPPGPLAPSSLHDDRNPDLLEPHILRSLSNVKTASIHTSCSGCHFVALDIDGNAWLFGRNGSSALGVAGVDHVSENAPRRVSPSELGAGKRAKFVYATCGRNHTLLVDSDGGVWSAGANTYGQVGPSTFHVSQGVSLLM